MNLTDEQLNIAICKWIGWTEIRECTFHVGCLRGLTPDKSDSSLLPSHIDGLEALGNMAEAEKGLTDDQYYNYLGELALIVGYSSNEHMDEWPNVELRKVVSAIALHRAIALLRVVSPELFTKGEK